MGKKNGQTAQFSKVNFSLVQNMDVDNLFGPLYADMKVLRWRVGRCFFDRFSSESNNK